MGEDPRQHDDRVGPGQRADAPDRGPRPRLGVAALPDRLDAGPIELRRWHPDCLDELMDALAISLDDLRPWLPWAQRMPSAEEEFAILEVGAAAFDADEEWAYMLHEVASGDLVGGIGLHRRVGPGGLEIGYLVRSD